MAFSPHRAGIALLLAGLGVPLAAQNSQDDAGTVVIGPPSLSDFRLSEDRRPAPSAEPMPEIGPLLPPEPRRSAPIQITPPAPGIRENTPTSERTPPPMTPARPAEADAPAGPAPVQATPEEQPTLNILPTTGLPPGILSDPDTIAPPVAVPVPSEGGSRLPVWFYVLIVLLIGAGALFVLSRRGAAPVEAFAAPAEVPTSPQHPAPLASAPATAPPTAQPAPARPPGLVSIAAPRPQLDLAFRPLRASTNDQQTEIQFELVIRNGGRLEARNVDIQARMFNAADEADTARFLAAGAQAGGNGTLAIPPGLEARATSAVAMPLRQVQPIRLPDRSLFVPLVAFNILYQWGDGRRGQTSRTFLVGRESEPPAEKMGAFRLDLGPRIYRSVGQRTAEMELVL